MFKKMTAMLSVLLCVTMLMSAAVVSARIETVNFALSCTDGEVGETVTISLSIPADSYFTNATMHLHYDSTALSFIEEGVGSASARGAMFMVNDKPAENTLSAAYVTINGIKKGGVLLTFDFEVLKKTPVPVTLTFNECVGVDANDVEFDVKYTTEGCVVNNDGSLTAPPVSEPTSAVTDVAPTNAPTTAPTAGGTTAAKPTVPGSTTAPDQTESGNTTDAPQTEPTAEVDTDLPTDDPQIEDKPVLVPSTVTDAKGEAVTDAEGVVVTTLVPSQENTQGSSDMTWLIVLAVCVVAAMIAVAAVVFIKKKQSNT